MEQAKYDVFISYSRKDSVIANNIINVFDKEGITYFIDKQGIGGGMEFPAVIARAIKESRIFLFLASKNSYTSKFTQSEIVYAFNKKQKQDIIPYIIDGSSLPEELEFTFSAINWRRLEEHPIDSVLVNDILFKIGKKRQQNVKADTAPTFNKQDIAKYRFWMGFGLLFGIFSLPIGIYSLFQTYKLYHSMKQNKTNESNTYMYHIKIYGAIYILYFIVILIIMTFK